MILEALELISEIGKLDASYKLENEVYLTDSYIEHINRGNIPKCLATFFHSIIWDLFELYNDWIQDEEILDEIKGYKIIDGKYKEGKYIKNSDWLNHVRKIRDRDYENYISDIRLLCGKYELGGIKLPEFINTAQEIIISLNK